MSLSEDFERPNGVIVPLTKTSISDGPREAAGSSDEFHRRTELNTQRALDETGFGKFNYKTIVICGLIAANVTHNIISLAFIIPSAACDLDMDSVAKGRISTSLLSGMIFGLFVWSWVADTRGRKSALRNCLFGQAFSECAAALVSNYWGFVFFKFVTGLMASSQITIIYAYLGEFQPTKNRAKVFGYIQIWFLIAEIFCPVLARLILPLNFGLTVSFVSFKSWNLFQLLGAVFPFLVGLSILTLPETPKYLAASGQYNDVYEVLTRMYRENTGNTSEDYLAKLNKLGILFSTNPNDESSNKGDVNNRLGSNNFLQFCQTLYSQIRGLFKRPYIGRTINITIVSYLSFSALFGLNFWFPEIFNRLAHFEEQHPGADVNLCIASEAASLMNANKFNETSANSSVSMMETSTRICDGTIASSVYSNSLKISLATIVTTTIFILTLGRLGFRFILVVSSFVSCAATLGIILVKSSFQNLIITCVYGSLTGISISVVHCLAVEIFPTHLRVSASTISTLFGKVGSCIGSMVFGHLVDLHCYPLIFIIAAQLFVCGVLTIFLTEVEPKKSMQK